MEEYQRWTLARLPVGDGLAFDLYSMQLSTGHPLRPNVGCSVSLSLDSMCMLVLTTAVCCIPSQLRV